MSPTLKRAGDTIKNNNWIQIYNHNYIFHLHINERLSQQQEEAHGRYRSPEKQFQLKNTFVQSYNYTIMLI